MDHGRPFIAMCRLAGEIQRLWEPRHGDFYYSAAEDRILCIVAGNLPYCRIKKGFGIHQGKKTVIEIAPMTWLPRLDQLMELAQTTGLRFEKTTQLFFDWTKTDYDRQGDLPRRWFASLEQLWLGFVMQQKFGKFWRGGRWVGRPEPRLH